MTVPITSSIAEPTTASLQLLHRAIPVDYRAEQTAQVADPIQVRDRHALTRVLIFRLAQEWLALSASICQQILLPVKSHILPHRSNHTLLGVVNIRGQLLLKVSLREVLGLPSSASTATDDAAVIKSRMVVVEKAWEGKATDVWVFEVDELHGIEALSTEAIQPTAAGIAAGSACTISTFDWNQQQVSLLDDAKLFHALRKRAL